jgi:excisionase family DNA binding protein
MAEDGPMFVRMETAARRVSVSRSRAYALARSGRFPGAVRIGGTWRVYLPALQAWAEREAAHPTADPRPNESPSPR